MLKLYLVDLEINNGNQIFNNKEELFKIQLINPLII